MNELIAAMIAEGDCPPGVIADALMDHNPDWKKEGDPLAKVYLVSGETGEYSDSVTWCVAAFLDKGKADALADALNRWCEEHHISTSDTHLTRSQYEALHCPLDPGFRSDYTGTGYGVSEVDLLG